jgi:hypothetical protein
MCLDPPVVAALLVPLSLAQKSAVMVVSNKTVAVLLVNLGRLESAVRRHPVIDLLAATDRMCSAMGVAPPSAQRLQVQKCAVITRDRRMVAVQVDSLGPETNVAALRPTINPSVAIRLTLSAHPDAV